MLEALLLKILLKTVQNNHQLAHLPGPFFDITMVRCFAFFCMHLLEKAEQVNEVKSALVVMSAVLTHRLGCLLETAEPVKPFL